MDLSVAIEIENSWDEIPIDENFKLYAGPGAGKTTFLTNHIKRILRNSPKLGKVRKVACITYTNTGVNALLNKLEDSNDSLEICTIHSFCYKNIVKPYLWLLNDISFPIHKLDGHETVVIRHSQLRKFKSESAQNYITDNGELVNALSQLRWIYKDNDVTLGYINTWDGKIGELSLKKSSYQLYKDICWEDGKLSHEDVLYFSYKLLKQDERIREILRAKFPYLLIDEFQDTSPLQSEIVKMIAQKEVKLGIIGDLCQSIFSFQGANVDSFESFTLPNMKLYNLKNNHRSSDEIIKVLNHMRLHKDFIQNTLSKSGIAPVALIGTKGEAFAYLQNQNLEKGFTTLSYRQESFDSINSSAPPLNNKEDILVKDSDKDRGWRIFFTIKAIELAKQYRIKEALKSMKSAYRKISDFDDRSAFMNLKRLITNYDEYKNESITKFNNDFITGYYGVGGKVSRGGVKILYDGITYNHIATQQKIPNDFGDIKTIHQSKGDEFDNVLVLISPKKNCLEFLLNPNMDLEEHRVYYVALSRAKSGLYINVPTIEVEHRKILQDIGFEIINCS